MGERDLFWIDRLSWRRRIAGLAALVAAFGGLTVIATWPHIRRLDSVPDMGDPLFSVWRIAWISHQLPRHPLDLFQANIFYPERLTLTYSDPVIVPGLMSAPLFWLGLHPLHVYNVLFLSAFVLSGVAMYALVRALTGQWHAAAVAGVIFTSYPYRFEHYSHLELQMTMWMPLALWGVHRAMASGRWRDGLAAGAAFALQMLSSLYYGLFLAVYLLPFGAALWIGRRCPLRPLLALGAGGLLAAIVVAPVAMQYVANQSVLGERAVSTVASYSASGSDYLHSHRSSWLYGKWLAGGSGEREVFPTITPVALAAIAVWPPLSVARIGYILGLVVAFEGSLGLNGDIYPWLYEHVAAFRGLRSPARFSMLVGLTLAILAGYGVARTSRRWPRAAWAVMTLAVACVVGETRPSLRLETIWREPPPIYEVLAGAPPAVLAEFPMGNERRGWWYDTRYMYFSTFHWQRLVNGNSGFFPPSYLSLVERIGDAPATDAALSALHERGVEYMAIHGGATFYDTEHFRAIAAALEARRASHHDVQLITIAHWAGGESRLYRLLPPSPAATVQSTSTPRSPVGPEW